MKERRKKEKNERKEGRKEDMKDFNFKASKVRISVRKEKVLTTLFLKNTQVIAVCSQE
jgi:hypothetical protein